MRFLKRRSFQRKFRGSRKGRAYFNASSSYRPSRGFMPRMTFKNILTSVLLLLGLGFIWGKIGNSSSKK